MPTRLTVNEIFFSIQGESSRMGMPCVFVRLTGCDLRCSWCDTEYAFHEGRKLTVDEILAAVERHPCELVELTGGEPLLQPGSLELMRALADRGKQVLLETGGHVDISGVDPRVVRIVDVKCPASGECAQNRYPNLAVLTAADEVKFVIADRADFDWAAACVRERLGGFAGSVLFSPVHGRLAPSELAAWVLESGLRVRLQLQLHKHIWGPDVRGV